MSERRRIMVSGASGLIGTRLVRALEADGHEVSRLVRREPAAPSEYRWDPYRDYIDSVALQSVDAVVHLSGAGIGDKRWTRARKQVLYDSRVITTRVLAEHLASLDEPPRVLIAQSAIGVYGDRGDELLTEGSSVGSRDEFLTDLTIDWERAAAPAIASGIRVVNSRTGLVLDGQAPLMRRLIPLFRAGLGGPLGDGRQWWSWIILSDVVAAIEHLLGSDLAGPVNLVSPHPVRQLEFARTLAEMVHRPALLPTPRLGIQAALGAEKANSIALSSTRVAPELLLADGFEHGDSDLGTALRAIVS